MSRQLFFFLATGFVMCTAFISCAKDTNHDAKGGDLPTHYVSVGDSSFTPVLLNLTSGSSITFVNNTLNAQSIITNDSVTIRATTIAPNSSYIFKKDTSGFFYYHLTNKPSIIGAFQLNP